jgi:hypothetical protein
LANLKSASIAFHANNRLRWKDLPGTGTAPFSIMTFSTMTFSIMTFSIMTLSIMILSLMQFSITIRKCNTKHNGNQHNN